MVAPADGLEIASLGSGSSGNSLLVRSRSTTLLLDCGFTLKETLVRLGHLGVSPESLDAILVTHEHGDHLKGVGPLSRKFNLPVWMTFGTYRACRDKKITRVHQFHAHDSFVIGDISLDPFPTPHDAAESCQFVFSTDRVKFACMTDLGAVTPHVLDKVSGANALLVESNYDPEMLRLGPYPPSLQARITGAWGHLANEQAGEVLETLDHSNLQHVMLGHLSERNNTDDTARGTVTGYMSGDTNRVSVLQQHACSPWITLE